VIQDVEFRFEGGRSGVLLIHGLTGTPTEMRLVGKGLNRAGLSVYGMQLAGHCGDVPDLLATGWKDWYASVEAAAERYRKEVDHLFVAGLSMGAVLALKLAADHPSWVRGVGVYGATFRYDGWAVPWYSRLSFLLPLIGRLGIGKNLMVHENEPYGLRDERLRAQISGMMLGGDSAAAGLPGNPWPSLAQMYDMAAVVRRDLPKVLYRACHRRRCGQSGKRLPGGAFRIRPGGDAVTRRQLSHDHHRSRATHAEPAFRGLLRQNRRQFRAQRVRRRRLSRL
jgi:carboxylesterase